MNRTKYSPAVNFGWTNQIMMGLIKNGNKVTASTFCVLLSINRALRLNKEPEGLVITHNLIKDFWVSRQVMNRTLSQLEAAGFIKIIRNNGNAPKIDLLVLPPSFSAHKK